MVIEARRYADYLWRSGKEEQHGEIACSVPNTKTGGLFMLLNLNSKSHFTTEKNEARRG